MAARRIAVISNGVLWSSCSRPRFLVSFSAEDVLPAIVGRGQSAFRIVRVAAVLCVVLRLGLL